MAANNLGWQSKSAEVIWSVHSSVAASRSLQTRAVQIQAVRSLVFKCEQQLYAIAADQVVEVLETPIMTPVPGAPEWFAGLAVYRASPVPVVDLGKYFAFDSAPQNETTSQTEQSNNMERNQKEQKLDRVIAVECFGSTYLLLVNKVLSLSQLPKVNATTGLAVESVMNPPTEEVLHSNSFDNPYNNSRGNDTHGNDVQSNGMQSNGGHRAIERVCHFEQSRVAVISLPDFLRATKFLRECFPI